MTNPKMDSKGQWFRHYTDGHRNLKLRRLHPADQVFFWWLCELTKEEKYPCSIDDLVWYLRLPEQEISAHIHVLKKAKLLNLDGSIKGWNERQHKTDGQTSAERTRDWRERQKGQEVSGGDAAVTTSGCHGDVTGDAPEQNRTEQNRSNPPGPEGDDVRPAVLIGQPKVIETGMKILTPYTDAQPLLLAELFKARIIENNPKAKPPSTLTAWAKTIDLMIRIDKRTPAEIREIILWSQRHEFWASNILSAAKLRKQFDTLWMQKKRDDNPSPQDRKEREKADRTAMSARKKTVAMLVQEGNGDEAELQIQAAPERMQSELYRHLNNLIYNQDGGQP